MTDSERDMEPWSLFIDDNQNSIESFLEFSLFPLSVTLILRLIVGQLSNQSIHYDFLPIHCCAKVILSILSFDFLYGGVRFNSFRSQLGFSRLDLLYFNFRL